MEEITGFDDGPMHPAWRGRGTEPAEDLLREEAIAVYREFSASNALVCNARLGSAE